MHPAAAHVHVVKTLNHNGSVSGRVSWLVQFPFLGTASFGRNKGKAGLANYEKGITGELSELQVPFDSLHG